MIVDVTFPAAVVHVPRGARKPKLTYARGRGSFEMGHAPASTFRPLHVLRTPAVAKEGDLPVLERDGVLWKPLTAPAGDDRSVRRPITHDEWRAFLTSEWDGHGHPPDLTREFERTPLSAVYAEGSNRTNRIERTTRGAALDAGAQRLVDRDDRPAAAAAVARFLEGEVLLTEDGVMARYRPLANLNWGRPHLVYADIPIWAGTGFPPVRPDRAEEALAFWARHAHPGTRLPGIGPGFVEAREALSGFETDDDLAFMASRLPARVSWLLDDVTARGAFQARPGYDDRLARARSTLFELGVRGATGDVGPEEAYDVLAELRGIVRLARDEHLMHYARRDWDALTDYLDALPARRAAPMPEEDAEAMAGLGMR